jgi:AAA domain/Domain of unknown function (DUF3854)/Ribonuclease R winged-helix domain
MFDPTAFQPDHLADLRKSGLSDETILHAGIYSVRPHDIRKITAVDGVISLLAIPYHQDFTRYKVFPSDLKAKTKTGKLRYIQPFASGVHLYVPPMIRDRLMDLLTPLGIVEGEKKALKACQEGIPCVAIGGIWNWMNDGRLMDDLKAIPLKGREVTLYPDSDVWHSKRQDLLEAIYRLGRALEAEGAVLKVCVIRPAPGQTKQGLDDYLLTHPREALEALPHISLLHKRFERIAQREKARENFGQVRVPTRRGKKLKDLMLKVFPVPKAVVPEMVLEGTTLFAGKPKLGKSRLMLDIAIAVACGGKALGKIPVGAGPVLYISLEDPERRLQLRAKAMLIDGCAAPENFEYETEWPRANEGGLADLDLWLREHPSAKLVVIDTLKNFRPKPLKGQNPYDADYEALKGLTELAQRYAGLAIVVVHHTNKQKDVEDFMDLISGTTGLPGSADGFAVMLRSRGEEDAILKVTHRDLLEDQEHALQSDTLTGGWTFMGPADAQANSPEQRQILDVLADALEPMTPKGIADVLSKRSEAVRFLLWKMEQAGLVDRVGTGKYIIPPDYQHSTTTNNANGTNNAKTTNDTNTTRESVSGSVSALAVEANTANAAQTAPALDLKASVSVVSDVSTPVSPRTQQTACLSCGSNDFAPMNGHILCMECFKRDASNATRGSSTS